VGQTARIDEDKMDMSRDGYFLGAGAVLLWLGALSGCSAPSAHDLAEARGPLIYGSDDRRDVYEIEDVEARSLALSGTAALMPPRSVRSTATGSLTFGSETLIDVFDLCESERFVRQPSLANCSGVLLDDDLVVTAAHCVTFLPCQDQLWVFGYAIRSEGARPQLDEGGVYRCRSVPVHHYGATDDGRRLDFAVVQLDRPVSMDQRAASLATAVIPTGERATVIGYPSGLPAKVDRGATVLDAREAEQDYVRLASDTFIGSSGSGVFNGQNELVAIVVRGGEDYEHRPDSGCYVSRRIVEGQELGKGEHASYVGSAISALCASGWSSERLCHRSSACGDAQCSLDEHTGPCSSDCPAIDLRGRLALQGGGGCALAKGRPPSGSWALLACAALARARRRRVLSAAARRRWHQSPARPVARRDRYSCAGAPASTRLP
jgi:V8-like Glu-specific endopeptidase